jgi:hypothetical protein
VLLPWLPRSSPFAKDVWICLLFLKTFLGLKCLPEVGPLLTFLLRFLRLSFFLSGVAPIKLLMVWIITGRCVPFQPSSIIYFVPLFPVTPEKGVMIPIDLVFFRFGFLMFGETPSIMWPF